VRAVVRLLFCINKLIKIGMFTVLVKPAIKPGIVVFQTESR
jgi:hypothetical protein